MPSGTGRRRTRSKNAGPTTSQMVALRGLFGVLGISWVIALVLVLLLVLVLDH
jgi:hypothetical protein